MGMNDMREKIAEQWWLKLRDFWPAAFWDDEYIDLSKQAKNEMLIYADRILSLETKTHRIAVIKKGEPLVLSEDEISKLFPDAIRFMASLKIVAQAQYDKVRKGV